MLRKAEKKRTKIRMSIAGSAGSGKTYSALLIAYGLCGDWQKIVVIDSERESANYYADMGAFNVCPLNPPFTPEAYIKAIEECEAAGMEVIIIDSISHEWNGVGGCLETIDKLKAQTENKLSPWAQVTPRHNKFLQKIISANAHTICTVRAESVAAFEKDERGKTVVVTIPAKEQTRDNFLYEMRICLKIYREGHLCSVEKDNTQLFGDAQFVCTIQTGERIRDWCNSGAEPAPMFQNADGKPLNGATRPITQPPVQNTPKTEPVEAQGIAPNNATTVGAQHAAPLQTAERYASESDIRKFLHLFQENRFYLTEEQANAIQNIIAQINAEGVLDKDLKKFNDTLLKRIAQGMDVETDVRQMQEQIAKSNKIPTANKEAALIALTTLPNIHACKAEALRVLSGEAQYQQVKQPNLIPA